MIYGIIKLNYDHSFAERRFLSYEIVVDSMMNGSKQKL